jgi:uncharacterized protein YbaR (Trm112 family)
MGTTETNDKRLDDLLGLAVCPQSRQGLRRASKALVDRLNVMIVDRALRNVAGDLVERSIEQGLVRHDGERLYVVRGGIAVLMVEQAILLQDEERALIPL